MLFIALLITLGLLAALADRLGAPGLANWPARMRLAMALALLLAGSDHLLNPQRYLPMMPELLPYPLGLVLFTGLCELAGAIGLLLPRWRRWAALALALYFVCVFPANIKNALDGLNVAGLPAASWYYWLRLPFQPLIILWALYAGEWIGRPRVEQASWEPVE
ncbi:DoxX family protein [Pseudomonas zhanjiangensis]|uniref:DoxX family protein n=1 Tax=Pseudomonas zhanjiangensis TaxID=3239015 RepID=A0ABV3YXQ8_9PSED